MDLLTEFGVYGDIGSVKIMWPRTEEERARQRNCGFVNFMRRPDAADCLDALKGIHVFGQDLRIGWGKRMNTPLHPLPMPKPAEKVRFFWSSADFLKVLVVSNLQVTAFFPSCKIVK